MEEYNDPLNKNLGNKEFLNYLGGVVAGDGCLVKTSNSELSLGSIKLYLSDEGWVRGLYDLIQPVGEFCRSEGRQAQKDSYVRRDSFGFTMSDRGLLKWMVGHGLVSRKSCRPESFMWADEGYEWYFLRGLLDSDGCVSFNKGFLKRVVLTWLGTEAQMNYVLGVMKLIGVEVFPRKVGRIVEVKVFGDRAVEVVKSLPKEEDFLLKRKTERMLEASLEIIGKGGKRDFSFRKMELIDWKVLYEEGYLKGGKSLRVLEKETGVFCRSIGKVFERMGFQLRKKWEVSPGSETIRGVTNKKLLEVDWEFWEGKIKEGGFSWAQMSRELGISYQTLQYNYDKWKSRGVE